MTVAVIIYGDKSLFALVIVEVNFHMYRAWLRTLGQYSLGVSTG